MATAQSPLLERLRYLRNTRRLSQEALADKSGRSVETISNIERGTSSPTLNTLEQLLAAVRTLNNKELEIAVLQIEALAGKRNPLS